MAESTKPILEMPLEQVMRPHIALTLQHVMNIYTVGSFLRAWKSPRNHRQIEQVFDSPQQAHHAAAVCAAWLGIRAPAQTQPTPPAGWWRTDEQSDNHSAAA